jgi:hypothetical protein
MADFRTRLSLSHALSWVVIGTRNGTERLLASGLLLFCAVCVASLLSCDLERPTSVAVAPGPSFVFSGSGRLAVFTVYGPRAGERVSYPHQDVSTIIWQIRPSAGYFDGVYVDSFRLTYGAVPQGYTQTVPSQSQVTPRLLPGLVYSFFAETAGAAVKDGFFYMSGTQPVQTVIPDLCLDLVNGHEIRVSCSDKQPYKEPTDLEGVVLENRTNK